MESSQLQIRPRTLVHLVMSLNAALLLLPFTVVFLVIQPWIGLPVLLVFHMAWVKKDSWLVALLFLALTVAGWMWAGISVWNLIKAD